MSELTKLQKISALSKDLMNKKMNDTDRFVHLSHIHELAEELQPELSESQQIVLDWLKEKYTVTNIEPIELFWRLRVNSIKPDYRGRPVYRSYRYMSKIGQLQVIQAFSRWALEQEKAE